MSRCRFVKAKQFDKCFVNLLYKPCLMFLKVYIIICFMREATEGKVLYIMQKQPIGIFDSGVGGLTVLREIMRMLPGENTIYVGDTARVPYGTKSPETIIRYSKEIASFLLARKIKLLVIACNTASAAALSVLQQALPIPVIGVIEPGAKRAVAATRNGIIGVIGTPATIRSKAYGNAIKRINPKLSVYTQSCPLFVPLAEEGWVDNNVARLTAEIYLHELHSKNVDTVVLGCTHYPLLKEVISSVLGSNVTLVDSAEETVVAIRQALEKHQMLNLEGIMGRHSCFVTDLPESFVRTGSRFLGTELEGVEQVGFGDT